MIESNSLQTYQWNVFSHIAVQETLSHTNLLILYKNPNIQTFQGNTDFFVMPFHSISLKFWKIKTMKAIVGPLLEFTKNIQLLPRLPPPKRDDFTALAERYFKRPDQHFLTWHQIRVIIPLEINMYETF